MRIEDLERLAKRANQRLRQLEKTRINKDDASSPSLSTLSSAYRELKVRAYDQRSGMTITKSYKTKSGEIKGGNIAFRRDFSKMSTAELADMAEALEEFFGYKTTVVKATREAYESSYQTYMERATGKRAKAEGKAYTPLSRAQYNALWTSSAAKQFGYEKVLAVAKRTGNLDAIKYLNEALADSVEEQVRNKEQLAEDELVENVLKYMKEHPKPEE